MRREKICRSRLQPKEDSRRQIERQPKTKMMRGEIVRWRGQVVVFLDEAEGDGDGDGMGDEERMEGEEKVRIGWARLDWGEQ